LTRDRNFPSVTTSPPLAGMSSETFVPIAIPTSTFESAS
jgi:hypothetical protein